LASAAGRGTVASIVGMDTVTKPQPANRETVAAFLFGPLAIREGTRSLVDRDLGATGPKQVLEIPFGPGGHRSPTDRVTDLLWGEHLSQNAAVALLSFISVFRCRRSASTVAEEVREVPRP
jgi:hypothetical protein